MARGWLVLVVLACLPARVDGMDYLRRGLGALNPSTLLGAMARQRDALDCHGPTTSYHDLATVAAKKVGAGRPVFPCVDWYDAKLISETQATLSEGHLDAMKAPKLGGHGYLGDAKYSENTNGFLNGDALKEWVTDEDGNRGSWPHWGPPAGPTKWPDQILHYCKKFADALNALPDTAETVYRGGFAKASAIAALKPGDVQQRHGFTSTTSDRSWCEGFAHDYNWPQNEEKTKIPGYVAVVYTIEAKRLKDVRQLNPTESELVFLPNTKLKVTGVEGPLPNFLFAAYDSEKVAAFLEAFEPPMAKAAARVRQESITGERIMLKHVLEDWFAAQDMITGGVTRYGPDDELDFKYTDADGEKRNLYNMIRVGQGAGEFADMFKPKLANLPAAGSLLNVQSKVPMYFEVALVEETAPAAESH